MIIIIICLALLLALAPFGALAIGVLIIRKTHKCTYDYAVWFISETFKDLIYRRNYCWLHGTDFPNVLKSDLECLFTDEIKKQWNNVFLLKSTVSQNAGVDNENVAFYSFLIPWDEEKKVTYDQMISNLCEVYLKNMHCSILDVLIDYMDWNFPNYRMCRIRYARTVTELDSLQKMFQKHDSDSMGITGAEIHDAELDMDLSIFGDDINVSN